MFAFINLSYTLNKMEHRSINKYMSLIFTTDSNHRFTDGFKLLQKRKFSDELFKSGATGYTVHKTISFGGILSFRQ